MLAEIRPGYGEIGEIRKLFDEYARMLGVDLEYQDYSGELKNLPGKYAPPLGRLYIAAYGGDTAGCAALRPLSEKTCEMKRLFVRPEFRGNGLGEALARKIIWDAGGIGYDFMVLDTMASLESAVRLYKGLGFYEIEPYCYNPDENAMFLRLDLRRGVFPQ